MGNVLWREDQPHFVDFDDARMGPAVQDLWMLLSGDEDSQSIQMNRILKGYRDFRDFNTSELLLIEPLRTLRMMYHAAWLARRWDDPAFPRAFPFFNTQRYWSEHILELREQWAAIEAPAISLYY
jgi:Ser/Thr protein kinase RdoA (MazF antagonist)